MIAGVGEIESSPCGNVLLSAAAAAAMDYLHAAQVFADDLYQNVIYQRVGAAAHSV